GCSEKARIHFEGTRDLAGQPTLPEGFGLSQENLDGQHARGPGGQGGDSLGSAHRTSSFHLAVARRSNSSVSRWYRSVSAMMASRTRARSARNAGSSRRLRSSVSSIAFLLSVCDFGCPAVISDGWTVNFIASGDGACANNAPLPDY